MRWNHIEERYFTGELTDLDRRTQIILKHNGITRWQDIPNNLDDLDWLGGKARSRKRFLTLWLMRCNGFCAIKL